MYSTKIAIVRSNFANLLNTYFKRKVILVQNVY